MEFKLETEMTGPVYRWLKDQGLLVKKEFNTPWGICDLVGVDFNRNNVKKRIKYGQNRSIGSLLKATLLNNIPDIDERKSITSKRLYKLFNGFIDNDRIEYELALLMKNKFIQAAKKNHYYKLNGWMPLQKRIVAVELKLNRIQEVIGQAYNHRLFTTESYVALPKEIAVRVVASNKKDDFIKLGIGLLSVSNNKCKITIKSKSPADVIKNNLQTYLIDRFWVSYLKGNLT